MRGWKRSVLAIMVLLIFFGFSAVNVVSAEKAVIVSDVRGLRNYVFMDDAFTHGSTLTVYTEMSGVNHRGFILVDFVFIIEDPLGNVVSIDRMNTRYRTYNDTAYVAYTKEIPSWWWYGKYRIKICAYNRLNKAKINELKREVIVQSTLDALLDADDDDDFELIEEFFANACDGDEDDLKELDVIKDYGDSISEITYISFFLRREEEIEKKIVLEADKFTVIDFRMNKFTVKPNETVSMSVTVKNGGKKRTETIALAINDKIEFEESVTLDYMESKTLFLQVKKDLPGHYKVAIPGTDIVKQLFVEESYGEEETENSQRSLSVSAMPEAMEPPGSGPPIYIYGIAVIAVVILVITLWYLRYKQLHYR
ncbi:MAG TPA: hypothetical protein EYP28_06515 [Methanophagales archaeon]|nr:hypothetical protein [Methanophagales archaeon]